MPSIVSSSADRAQFRPARVRFVDSLEIEETVLKLYGSQVEGVALNPRATQAAQQLAARELRMNGRCDESNGVGFLLVYQDRTGVHVTLDRWQNETELLHAGFIAGGEPPFMFQSITKGEEVLPEWYLGLVEFERNAWRRCVLERLSNPDLAGYLAARLGAPGSARA